MATQECPCGFLGHPRKPCRCTPHQIKLYRGRLSGPLLDRIDIHIEVPAVTASELMRGMGRRRTGGPRAADGSRATFAPGGPDRSGGPAGSDELPGAGETSADIRARVESAREIQLRRFDQLRPGGRARGNDRPHYDEQGSIHCNAQMGIPEIEEFCRTDDSTRAFLQKAIESLSLSARAAHRSLRVARTIADLAGSAEIQLEHVAEAVQYQALYREGISD